MKTELENADKMLSTVSDSVRGSWRSINVFYIVVIKTERKWKQSVTTLMMRESSEGRQDLTAWTEQRAQRRTEEGLQWAPVFSFLPIIRSVFLSEHPDFP